MSLRTVFLDRSIEAPYPRREMSQKQALWVFILYTLVGCASSKTLPENEKSTPVIETAPTPNLQTADLVSRIEMLESKLEALHAKMETNSPKKPEISESKLEVVDIMTQKLPSTPTDTNPSLAQYQEAKVQYDAQDYSGAIIKFSQWLLSNPSHPLSGSAQFYLGDSYFLNKEYRLAKTEWEKGLEHYPYSPHIADTYQKLTKVCELLGLHQESIQYQNRLVSYFPQSPWVEVTAP